MQPQLLSHSLAKSVANELVGSVLSAEPGFCVAVELDLSPSHGWLRYRGGRTSYGATPKPFWLPTEADQLG